MLFNSFEFLAFATIVVAVFPLVGAKFGRRGAIIWLVAASIFFYGWWNPAHVPLLVGSVLVNYALGKRLSRRPSAPLCALGIVFNLCLLGTFKYANFFVDTARSLAGMAPVDLGILLPLAISFFTFQQIAFLVDSYRGKTAIRGIGQYALFVVFFPQLIAGPIVHHSEMAPQLARLRIGRLNGLDLSVGLTIFTIGLFKKVVIADGLARYADPVFDAADMGLPIAFAEAWGGALAYSLQIYFDFSGYSDMAIGLARLFGIRLPTNFNAPYKAANIGDFWRRWHMTLSRFLRAYLYIPLGGNRRGVLVRYRNLFIVMLLGGLWHGAGWTFVLWGALHGVYLVVHRAWSAVTARLGIPPMPRWAARLITFLSVVVAWVIFRAQSMDGARTILTAMIPSWPLSLPDRLEAPLGGFGLGEGVFVFEATPFFFGVGQLLALSALLMLVWFGATTQEYLARYRPVIEPQRPGRWPVWRPTPIHAVATGILSALCIGRLIAGDKVEFLYFQF